MSRPLAIQLRDAAQTVAARSNNTCEVCSDPASEFHHRRPRGMGGTSDPYQHSPANLLHVCPNCHAWIESHSQIAYDMGWKIRHNQTPPDEVRVRYQSQWALLDNTGTVDYDYDQEDY